MMDLLFATNNGHKLTEVRHALMPDFRILSLTDIGCKDELPETGNTLEANAKQKAEYLFTKYKLACFADDTGLEVESLDNEPGVYSARYAGPQRNSEENIDLLLRKLEGEKNRKARFRTVICWFTSTNIHFFEGIVKGEITLARKGSQGFGYDSVFIPEGYQISFAEMTLAQKNQLSHRTQAVNKLIRFLKTQ